MEAKAIAKGLRIPPRKCRLVVDLIRGKSVIEADTILKNMNKEAARLTIKVLTSAVANAENNLGLDKTKLYVKEAYVNEGQTLKRMKFGSRGHVDPIKKRTSHITVVVSDEKQCKGGKLVGQKVSPVGLRIGINRDWESNWYADNKNFAKYLDEDVKIRRFLEKKLKDASVSSIVIERTSKKTEIIINTAKPGVIIGHGGEEIEKLKKEVSRLVKSKNLQISIKEVKNPDLDAALVAENIARQIEGRVSFRIAQKRAIRNTMKAGAKGITTSVSGRLGGADMARTEGYTEGSVPRHTLRANIDYAHKEADTTYGKIGVKVWICKGEILPAKNKGGNEDGRNTKKN